MTFHQRFQRYLFSSVWKEITLNASNDQKKFRVWDYPVKEQYGQILEAIEKTGPVPDAKTGFDKVNGSFLLYLYLIIYIIEMLPWRPNQQIKI